MGSCCVGGGVRRWGGFFALPTFLCKLARDKFSAFRGATRGERERCWVDWFREKLAFGCGFGRTGVLVIARVLTLILAYRNLLNQNFKTTLR